ncbi:hypothetical protein BDQ17DRAFT_1235809 [Cyathus striatus]|nr:hypothetical protein BDQ17DRAFT_1235809 [Cyathus striatus]
MIFLVLKFGYLDLLLDHIPRISESNAASEWKDDTWPLRPQTPWDISTDFPHPRVLDYEVQEGTWLRLDIHPKSGDIVFDMIGDLYCIPGHEAFNSQNARARARPILLGVPHDSDPHFSPEGDRIVFRSDAELGIENIWVMAWRGCKEMDLRSADSGSMLFSEADEQDESLLAKGVPENARRMHRRLHREGRFRAQRVTNETYRWISDARFHPSGSKVIATKWYTSSRSLGAGEGWVYDVPSLSDLHKEGKKRRVAAGSGSQLIGRTLPPGWSGEDYGDQQIGPEQFVWRGNDAVIFSKNIRDQSKFEYSKDVHKGIYAIFQRNLTTGVTETVVDAVPGGASRPELSRDGRTLAFVRRVRDKQALVLKDLLSGTIHHVWYGLTYDLSGISAPMGTYPSFAFTPEDDAVIIWAAGQIYRVPLSVNHDGEKEASPTDSPTPIKFTAHIKKRLAKTLKGGADIVGLETQDTQRVRAFKELRADDKGKKVVFQAAGVTYLQEVGKKGASKVPVRHENAPYYSPSFVHGASDLVIHARWSDTKFSSFELANISSGVAYELNGLPLGRYSSPVLCECDSARRQIAFIKSAGDYMSGDIVATAGAGLYIGDIALPSSTDSLEEHSLTINNIRFIPSEIDVDDRVSLRFLEKNKKLLVEQSTRSFVIEFDKHADKFGKYKHQTISSGKMSAEVSVNPVYDWQRCNHGIVQGKQSVAFVDFFHVYLAHAGGELWSKPANASKGLVRLSLDGGHDVTWARNGKKLFWLLGPYLHSLEVSNLKKCESAIRHDHDTFGISCVKELVEFQEVVVEHPTDIARLKNEAAKEAHSHKDWLKVESNNNLVIIMNATLLTMETGSIEKDLVHRAVLVTQNGLIDSIYSVAEFVVPTGATVINAEGGFVIPGFIDVHAHWEGFAHRYPTKSWEMEAFLAYGVTTLHNPSADTVTGFVERSRVENGQMIGPRIFTVGDVIYGGGEPGLHQDIVDIDEAYSALIRIKAEGGPASISYKNYNLPSRASRQRLLLAARNLSMLCVPEGGMNYDWDLTYIIDGMTTVEHALPVPTLYEDVLTLFALSGTGSTPTHIVNYGGAWGEQLVWATEDISNDPKLRQFVKHDILEFFSESTSRPVNSYALFNTSASVAKMVEKGLLANIGAHGEPPLGVNYHAEMSFTKAGGLSNYQVLQAATASGAKTLGIFSSLGSLAPGKLADYLIYPADVDLLEGDIKQTRNIKYVVRGGRIWNASTMEEVWPVKGRKQQLPPLNAD